MPCVTKSKKNKDPNKDSWPKDYNSTTFNFLNLDIEQGYSIPLQPKFQIGCIVAGSIEQWSNGNVTTFQGA